MRNAKDTKPVDPESLTYCTPCIGRAHLRCDCPLVLVSDDDFSDEFEDEPTLVQE